MRVSWLAAGLEGLDDKHAAATGSRGRGLLDQITGAARQDGALLWKSCFAEAVDINLS
jgi:hypothetical protein